MERDRHHVWHSRTWYTSSLDRRFRNYRGFVVPIDRDLHNELHATTLPPPKPLPLYQRGVLDHLGNFNLDYRDTLLRTADYFLIVSTMNEERHDYLARIGDNLLRQCDVMFDIGYRAAA